MIFKLHRSSGLICVPSTVEISTLEELFAFMVRVGEDIILSPGDDEIEIYDEERE